MKIEEVEDNSPQKDKELECALKLLKSYVKARDEGIAPKNPELEALLDVMKQQEGSSPENINLPKVGTERAKSETIVPQPLFVVKTATSKGEKIFVNICGSPKIPAPAEWEEGIPSEVQEALGGNEDSGSLLDIPNIRFPVSCSDPITSTDHGGKPCRVFDIVYNSSIVELAMSSKKMKLFLIEMATTWISQKYSLELRSDFKLPNMKYKGGEVSCQQIRATPIGPLVSEVPSDSDLDPSFPLLVKPQSLKAQGQKPNESSSSLPLEHPIGSATQTAPPSKNQCLPFRNPTSPADAMSLERAACNGEIKRKDSQQFQFFDMPVGPPLIELGYSSRPVDAVFVIISIPQLKIENLEVSVTYTVLLIETKFREPFEVSLPFCTELHSADGSYDPSTGLLTLKLPFLSYGEALDN